MCHNDVMAPHGGAQLRATQTPRNVVLGSGREGGTSGLKISIYTREREGH